MQIHFLVELDVPDEEVEKLSNAVWEAMPESEKRALEEQKLPEVRISEEVGEMYNRDHQRIVSSHLKGFVNKYRIIYVEYGEGRWFDRE